MPSIIVVDETCIQIGNKEFYLYAAICPETRGIIYFDLYPMRNYLATFSFFKVMITFYGRAPDLVVIDGGHWYLAALSRLGIKYQVVSGNIRNYIERWYETLKDRLKGFDIYFPHKKCFEHVFNWLYAFVYFYNRVMAKTMSDVNRRRHYRSVGCENVNADKLGNIYNMCLGQISHYIFL
ncbi:MAG: DDE-type integrase/transposase/recombinase [Methanocellales archaeon]